MQDTTIQATYCNRVIRGKVFTENIKNTLQTAIGVGSSPLQYNSTL